MGGGGGWVYRANADTALVQMEQSLQELVNSQVNHPPRQIVTEIDLCYDLVNYFQRLLSSEMFKTVTSRRGWNTKHLGQTVSPHQTTPD